MKQTEKTDLLQHFQDGLRKPALVGSTAVIPKLFKNDGDLRTAWATPDSTYKLSFAQLHFLKTFEETANLEESCVAAKRSLEWGKDFLKKHQLSGGYLWEKEKIKQIGLVATPEWTKAKAVQGVIGEWTPENPKLAVECLKIVKDINYPRASLTINQNNTYLQMPQMTPEQEAEVRQLADRLANAVDTEANPVA